LFSKPKVKSRGALDKMVGDEKKPISHDFHEAFRLRVMTLGVLSSAPDGAKHDVPIPLTFVT
jgi:hypothetical protein